ncbi:MAG: SLC13/DASS family transporter [Planctomycetes bacterium]|nr:SLC13/DASS family transporter [Planctomycetota bacterium]
MRARTGLLIAGPVLAIAVAVLCAWNGLATPAAWTAAVAVLCAWWWVTEAIPLPATSLLPFVLLPAGGVLDARVVARDLGDPLILLMLGGFLLGKGVERSGAHRRIAVTMVRAFGRFGRRGLVLGFMVATAFCSMWMSNSATALMMLPVVLAVLDHEKGDDLAVPLLLGVAYAASIGGVGTPVGTPPNPICLRAYRDATGETIGFLRWMSFGVPLMLLLLPCAWWIVVRKVVPGPAAQVSPAGAWQRAERRMLVVFGLTVLAWLTRKLPFAGGGWSAWLGVEGVGDETVALAAAVVVLALPHGDRPGERLLDWKSAASIPWDILLLFAGGIAIGSAFDASGLSKSLGDHLVALRDLPLWLLIAIIAATVTLLSELASNTAIANLLMPVLAAAATETGIDPLVLLVPATLAASSGFMLPIATPPNAIVYGSGRVPVRSMLRAGFALDVAGVVAITVVARFVLIPA